MCENMETSFPPHIFLYPLESQTEGGVLELQLPSVPDMLPGSDLAPSISWDWQWGPGVLATPNRAHTNGLTEAVVPDAL
jgi:hypothetical protein